jgi:hypothetical protein
MRITPRHPKTHWLALAGAAMWGMAEFVALCRSRWSQPPGDRR